MAQFFVATQRASSMSRQSSTPLASVPQPLALTSVNAHRAESSEQQATDRALMRFELTRFVRRGRLLGEPSASRLSSSTMASAIVLCAGFGTRLRPLTDELPKPLVPVGDRSILEHALASLEAAGISELSINVHHLAEQFRATLL